MPKPTKPIEGSGNCLFLTDENGNLVEIEKLITVPRPTSSVAALETIDQKSGAVDTFMGGKITPSQASFDVYYDPGSDQDVLLTEHLYSRETRPYKVIEKTSRNPETQETIGNMLMLSYVPDEAPIGGVRKATITFQPSGIPTTAPGA